MPEIIEDGVGNPIGVRTEWNREDVKTAWQRHTYPDEVGMCLSEDEIDDVLYKLADTFDAEHGINWETIECCIEDVLGNRSEKETKNV